MKTLAILLVAAAASAQTPQPTLVVKHDAEMIAALMQKVKANGQPDLTNVALAVGEGYRVSFVHRAAPGAALVHAGTGTATEVHYILEGSATFVTGGTIVNPTRGAGGSGAQAATIEGGVTHHLTKGDIAFVPPGVPHWYKEILSPVTYLEVRFDEAKK